MVMFVFAPVGHGYQNKENPQKTSLAAPMASVPWWLSAVQDSKGESVVFIIFPGTQNAVHLTEFGETCLSSCLLDPGSAIV